MLRQAVGSGSVLYHCDVSGSKILIASLNVGTAPSATTSADFRLKTPGDRLAVGMGGMVCFHLRDRSLYVYTSLLSFQVTFFTPPKATSWPLT